MENPDEARARANSISRDPPFMGSPLYECIVSALKVFLWDIWAFWAKKRSIGR